MFKSLFFTAVISWAALPAISLGDSPPPPGTVPLFVAFGHGDRTMVSCDDGKTWVANQFVEDREPGDDRYSEDQMRAMGLAYDNGVFVKWLGWNGPVKISRSENGVDWTVTADRDQGWAWDGAGANGVFLYSLGRERTRSVDGGKTWTSQKNNGIRIGHTHFLYGEAGEETRWIVYGDGKIVYSTDNGETWEAAELPEDEFSLRGSGAFGGGRFVIVPRFGEKGPRGPYIGAYSEDGGKTWQASQEVPERPRGILWDGERFLLFTSTDDVVYESPDGKAWSRVEDVSNAKGFTAFAQSDQGTYIALESGGGKPKEAGGESVIYRSDDGLHWEHVEVNVPGDQLTHVVFGYGQEPAACQ